MEDNKKLTYNIKRVKVQYDIPIKCYYEYKFNANYFLESMDEYKTFNLDEYEYKQMVIDNLVNEFRISLNSAVFGDPAGKDYVKYIKNI